MTRVFLSIHTLAVADMDLRDPPAAVTDGDSSSRFIDIMALSCLKMAVNVRPNSWRNGKKDSGAGRQLVKTCRHAATGIQLPFIALSLIIKKAADGNS
jgi:hypothetical protein